MLRAVSKVFGYLWSSNDESIASQNGDVDIDLAVNTPLHTSSHEKSVYGVITSIHSGYGVINNDIYFDFKTILGNIPPALGVPVHVVARRDRDAGGWRATLVTVETTAQWGVSGSVKADVGSKNESEFDFESDYHNDTVAQFSSTQSLSKEKMVAMVTEINGDSGYINNTVPFDCKDVVYGYVPYVGDWVQAEVVTNNTTLQCYAKNITPQRQEDFEGQISSVQHGFGFIDTDIYFTFSACVDSCSPRRGDPVQGVMVESNQGRCAWRALSVMHRKVTDRRVLNRSIPTTGPTLRKLHIELKENKRGVVIFPEEQLDFSSVDVDIAEKKSICFFVRNMSDRDKTLINIKVFPSGLISLRSEETALVIPKIDKMLIRPGAEKKISIECIPKLLGEDKALLVFEFSDGAKNFKIGRDAIWCGVSQDLKTLGPTAPYQRVRKYDKYRYFYQGDSSITCIPGQRPKMSKSRLPSFLPHFEVPKQLRDCVIDRSDPVQQVAALGQPLTMTNYYKRFSALLHFEEIERDREILLYSLYDVTLRPCGSFLVLHVPGLADDRPSVLVGDKVVVSRSVSNDLGPHCEAYVHKLFKESEEIYIKFPDSFHQEYLEEEYSVDVRFVINRTELRRCHQAAKLAKDLLGAQVLFPMNLHPKQPRCLTDNGKKLDESQIKFKNPILNKEQQSAVRRIVSGQSRPVPYIIYGPPGTGKTVTVVEAVLQVFFLTKGSRIIICTPSNSAADLMAVRLLKSGHVQQGDIVRFNAFSRVEKIPDILQPISQYDDGRLEQLARHRIVVCTLTTAGTLCQMGLKPGHFTHVFVDEAGQATEPNCLVPLGLVAGTANGQIILAGDPKQLGAVVKYKKYGFTQSLLERLISLPLYARDETRFADHGNYDPLLLTKLVKNYRSHPALLAMPSKLFYDDELEERADRAVTHCLCQWEKLPKKNFPVIFHGVQGEEMREGNVQSWFNPVEVIEVVKYVKSLLENSVTKLTTADIGIITPYRKQVEKIRLQLSNCGFPGVDVGTVEKFQGQERLVIIISMVRSTDLSFVSDAKRFNVAITRAQALLIILGNPVLLSQDENCHAFIQYCIDNGGYVGCDLPYVFATEAVVENFKDLVLSKNDIKQSSADSDSDVIVESFSDDQDER